MKSVIEEIYKGKSGDGFIKETDEFWEISDEIAALAVYFASDESAYTTGQVVEVAGGFGIPTPVFGDLTGGDTKR